ncbi:MAG: hypothetical protein RSC08_02545, partial [Oscillospiraceae bacterium]
SAWDGGDDGVRVTVLEERNTRASVDYSKKQRTRTTRSFTKQCKLEYLRSTQLDVSTVKYTNLIPTTPWVGNIISEEGECNIAAIKSYFTDKATLENLAADIGWDYKTLTNGHYKLMLEPIAYFKYDGVQWAMTATEAALYNMKLQGDLKTKMGRLTHQNMPLAMFLERADLGIAPWKGELSGKQSDVDVLKQLGVGIVSFSLEDVEVVPPTGDFIYRTDTDVVTAVALSTAYDVTPDNNAYVCFNINGRNYNKQFVCPGGYNQLVWVRWHTPTTPQDIAISVTSDAVPSLNTTITASVVALPEKVPPDPKFRDTHPKFKLADTPDWGSCRKLEWQQWIPLWHPPTTVWNSWKNMFVPVPGYWTFSVEEYQAQLKTEYKLTPAERVKTDFTLGGGKREMKSGYGLEADCRVVVVCAGGVSNNDVTPAQTVVSTFPDWAFQKYTRLLEPDLSGYKANWHFKQNDYSYYLDRVHFTPIWYPDDMEYVVPLAVFDAWTPAGQLYTTVSDSVRIDEGCAMDDWYIRLY